MRSLASKQFWLDSVERAIKTFCQTLVAIWGTGITGILQVDWTNSLSVALFAALLSVLSSVASVDVGDANSGSLLSTRTPSHATTQATATVSKREEK